MRCACIRTTKKIVNCLNFLLTTEDKRPHFRVAIGFAAQHACLADELIASWPGYPLSAEAVAQTLHVSLAVGCFRQ